MIRFRRLFHHCRAHPVPHSRPRSLLLRCPPCPHFRRREGGGTNPLTGDLLFFFGLRLQSLSVSRPTARPPRVMYRGGCVVKVVRRTRLADVDGPCCSDGSLLSLMMMLVACLLLHRGATGTSSSVTISKKVSFRKQGGTASLPSSRNHRGGSNDELLDSVWFVPFPLLDIITEKNRDRALVTSRFVLDGHHMGSSSQTHISLNFIYIFTAADTPNTRGFSFIACLPMGHCLLCFYAIHFSV